jgi:hypothetical protein
MHSRPPRARKIGAAALAVLQVFVLLAGSVAEAHGGEWDRVDAHVEAPDSSDCPAQHAPHLCVVCRALSGHAAAHAGLDRECASPVILAVALPPADVTGPELRWLGPAGPRGPPLR